VLTSRSEDSTARWITLQRASCQPCLTAALRDSRAVTATPAVVISMQYVCTERCSAVLLLLLLLALHEAAAAARAVSRTAAATAAGRVAGACNRRHRIINAV